MSVIQRLLTRTAGRPDRPSLNARDSTFWSVHSIQIATTVVMLLWLVWSCTDTRPRAVQAQIVDTRAALDEACLNEADRYAPNAMRLARTTFDHAISEVETQESRAFLFRSYEQAKQLLGRAKQAAYGAQFEATATREKTRQDSLHLINEAKETLQTLLEIGAVSPHNRAQAKLELEQLANTLAEAKWAYRTGDYLTALAKAEWVGNQIIVTTGPESP